MNLEELVRIVLENREKIDFNKIYPYLSLVPEDIKSYVFDLSQVGKAGYYLFLASLMQIIKPKQVVELGGSNGLSALFMLSMLEKDSRLYSISLPDPGQDFAWIQPRGYVNLNIVRGDDLNLNNWPEGLDLSATDFWFIDTSHTKEQLSKELELYTPFFKKDAIIAFDDIYENNGIKSVWEEVIQKYEHMDLTEECHSSGWGIIKV